MIVVSRKQHVFLEIDQQVKLTQYQLKYSFEVWEDFGQEKDLS